MRIQTTTISGQELRPQSLPLTGKDSAQHGPVVRAPEYSSLRAASPDLAKQNAPAPQQSWIGRTWKNIVSWMGSKSDQLCDSHGITDQGSRTAIAQTLNAADIALPEHYQARNSHTFGKINDNHMISEAAIAAVLGDLHDGPAALADRNEQREQWNSAVGDRIARYAAKHNLEGQMDKLVMDAYLSGALVTSLNDRRLGNTGSLHSAWVAPSGRFRAS